jgi:polyhydroxyalkanoate synthase subunit PhaC
MIPTAVVGAAGLTQEAADFNSKVASAIEKLATIRDEQVEIATTPKDLMLQSDKVTLYRYRPLVPGKIQTPMLLVYSLIGRQTMADLQEDRSLVRNLLNQGVDLWVVDWGSASRADRWLTIDDFVSGYLDECVEKMLQVTDREKVSLLGICEGGVFALAYAALEPARVHSVVLTITPLDFHADQAGDEHEQGFINVWTRNLTGEDVDRLIELWGVLPGPFMGTLFSMLSPARGMTKYNLDLLDVVDDEAKLLNFLRMEKWLADRPHHPGEAAKEWLKDLYQENKLIENRWELGGRPVDLQRVTMPVLNIYAEADTIIPPATSRALDGKLGTSDYTELGLRGGHIGVFVSSKSQGIVGKGVAQWLADRDA